MRSLQERLRAFADCTLYPVVSSEFCAGRSVTEVVSGIAAGGVLPRKTFSMGHAQEKRYYLECRKIVP